MEVHIKIRLFRYTDTQLVCYAYSRFQKNVAELVFFFKVVLKTSLANYQLLEEFLTERFEIVIPLRLVMQVNVACIPRDSCMFSF